MEKSILLVRLYEEQNHAILEEEDDVALHCRSVVAFDWLMNFYLQTSTSTRQFTAIFCGFVQVAGDELIELKSKCDRYQLVVLPDDRHVTVLKNSDSELRCPACCMPTG